MYLYVERGQELNAVPEPLHRLFTPLNHVMDLVLTPERKLAREDIKQVLENIQSQGFHLQMPPSPEEGIVHLPDELLTFNDPV